MIQDIFSQKDQRYVLLMKEKVTLLGKKELNALQKEFEVLTFTSDFDFVYEEQVPPAVIVIVEGKLELIKNSKVIQEVTSGHLLGMKQLLEETPVKTGCRVKGNSRVILLGKSHLLKSVKNKRSPLYSLMSSYV